MSIAALHASTDAGLSYLDSQKNLDSSYGQESDIATAFQSTSEALQTFRLLNYPLDGVTENTLLTYLDSMEYNSTENLSRKILAQSGNTAQLRESLLSHQNGDGSFGELKGYDGSGGQGRRFDGYAELRTQQRRRTARIYQQPGALRP